MKYQLHQRRSMPRRIITRLAKFLAGVRGSSSQSGKLACRRGIAIGARGARMP